jgi:BirA family biotin operon repressor/biotin-[acetyl-CoA-carboxylase] ligase
MTIHKFDTVSSTNDIAKSMIKSESDLFAVVADYQSNGQGRNGKNWFGEKGANIYLSVGIKHQNAIDIERTIIFQGIGCLAVINSIREFQGNGKFYVKYPNDIIGLLNNQYRKISGIIINNGFVGDRCDYTILGIGVNVNQEVFHDHIENIAGSLSQFGYKISKDVLLLKIINRIKEYLKFDFKTLYDMWYSELNIVGKEIQVVGKEDKHYKAFDFMTDGRLKLIDVNSNDMIYIDNGDSIRYIYE